MVLFGFLPCQVGVVRPKEISASLFHLRPHRFSVLYAVACEQSHDETPPRLLERIRCAARFRGADSKSSDTNNFRRLQP
jgi:hypothetical protein